MQTDDPRSELEQRQLRTRLLDAVDTHDLKTLERALNDADPKALVHTLNPYPSTPEILRSVFDAVWVDALPLLVKHGQRLNLRAPDYNPDAALGFSAFSLWHLAMIKISTSEVLVDPNQVRAMSESLVRWGARVDRMDGDISPLTEGLRSLTGVILLLDATDRTDRSKHLHLQALWSAFIDPLVDHLPAWNARNVDGSCAMDHLAQTPRLWNVPVTATMVQRAFDAGFDPHQRNGQHPSAVQVAEIAQNTAFLQGVRAWEATQLNNVAHDSLNTMPAPTVARSRL